MPDKRIGNQFWKQRPKHGKDKIFSTPEKLWDSACQYFQWVEDNPLIKIEAAKAGDHFGEHVEIPIIRPFTIHGLTIFLDCTTQTFHNYGNDKKYKDYFDVVSKIKKIIYTQKFDGAAVGMFNSSIIQRDLGLVDKQDVTQRKEVIKVTKKKKKK